jgi:hypothetical protein
MYQFLNCSSSQLRNQQAYFIHGIRPEDIRRQLVPESMILGPPHTLLSRMGLFCTADTPTVIVPKCKITIVPDSYVESGHMVTDGSGLIGRYINTY